MMLCLQEFGLDMFFRQRWQDKRLSHNMTTMMTLTMGTKHPADYIWVPDTMFVDATKSYMHNVLATNHKVDISAKGEVNWGTRYVLCNFTWMCLFSRARAHSFWRYLAWHRWSLVEIVIQIMKYYAVMIILKLLGSFLGIFQFQNRRLLCLHTFTIRTEMLKKNEKKKDCLWRRIDLAVNTLDSRPRSPGSRLSHCTSEVLLFYLEYKWS